jgi:hypothetical protein
MIGGEHQQQATARIAGERRGDRRYEVHLELGWKLIRWRRVLENGLGHTIDLSSGGIFFDSGRQLPVGQKVELSISWPVLLRNITPLQLIVTGRIVRSAGDRVAIQTLQHGFRTIVAQPEHRVPVATPVRTPSRTPIESQRPSRRP